MATTWKRPIRVRYSGAYAISDLARLIWRLLKRAAGTGPGRPAAPPRLRALAR